MTKSIYVVVCEDDQGCYNFVNLYRSYGELYEFLEESNSSIKLLHSAHTIDFEEIARKADRFYQITKNYRDTGMLVLEFFI